MFGRFLPCIKRQDLVGGSGVINSCRQSNECHSCTMPIGLMSPFSFLPHYLISILALTFHKAFGPMTFCYTVLIKATMTPVPYHSSNELNAPLFFVRCPVEGISSEQRKQRSFQRAEIRQESPGSVSKTESARDSQGWVRRASLRAGDEGPGSSTSRLEESLSRLWECYQQANANCGRG